MKKIFFLALLTPALNAMHHEMGEHNHSMGNTKEWEINTYTLVLHLHLLEIMQLS